MEKTIYHIYKGDCFHSSRLFMQTSWDPASMILCKTRKNASNDSKALAWNVAYEGLSFGAIDRHFRGANEDDVFVFHEQSTLLFLLLFWLKSKTSRASVSVVYDIHDLNEAPQNRFTYGYLRYLVMNVLEFIALYIFRVGATTVSAGLANIISQRYDCCKPIVVRNVPVEVFKYRARSGLDQRKLVYFGLFDRIDEGTLERIEAEGLVIHMYGKSKEFENSIIKRYQEKGVVQVHGEYSPEELCFLESYDCLLFNIEPTSKNLRYACANKFIQALESGLSILVSPGYVELIELFKDIPGAVGIIDEKGIRSNLAILSELRSKDYEARIRPFIASIRMEANHNYLKALGPLKS